MKKIATIFKDGRVTIPAEMRKRLGLLPGSVVLFEVNENKEVIIKPRFLACENGDDRKLDSKFTDAAFDTHISLFSQVTSTLTRPCKSLRRPFIHFRLSFSLRPLCIPTKQAGESSG